MDTSTSNTAATKVTARTSRNQPRLRTRARVDDLSHLAAGGGVSLEPVIPDLARDIAVSLVTFDALAINRLHEPFNSIGDDVIKACKDTTYEGLFSIVLEARATEAYEFAPGSRKYMTTLSNTAILAIVEEPTPPEWTQLLLREESALCKGKQYASHSQRDTVRSIAVLNEYKNACQSLVFAAEDGAISIPALRRLKQRMELLEGSFNDLAVAAKMDREVFDPSKLGGWHDIGRTNAKSTVPKDLEPSTTETKVFPDLRQQQSLTAAKATLSFIVPVVCLLSCVPAALAWTHGQRFPGRLTDSDFFQLIAGTALQLLNVLVLVYPTVFYERLTRGPWMWTWTLAAASALLTVLGAALYTSVRPALSFTLSFAGAIAQALVTLQLMQAT